ncbi:MAG: efflux RND transporter periplasmic adaptor subunit [Acidobacteriota bacterium]|nr:MAG: efflux RND transporter periplasmic adaptor subunit [Acidobacteriota bacterium]
MSENKITEPVEHHATDEAELDRPETNFDRSDENDIESEAPKKNPLVPWLATLGIVALIAIVGIAWIVSRSSTDGDKATGEQKDGPGHSENETGREVKLDPELLESAGISTETVTQRPAIAMVKVTGAVELNPERTEMATLLVGGRIERVNYGVGDYVQLGAVLAVVSSPQLAQMHGKMHEAKTKYELAERNLVRVQRSENRVAVLQAKAKLDEADATLRRTKRLIELGAGAGKDIVTAETNYRTAKAEFDFQSNIALNKELQEAKAEVETARVDLRHIEDELRALGVPVESNRPDDHRSNTSLVSLRAPLSGIVTERRFNAGAGVEAATPIFSISNLGTVYVIANVPEANMSKLFVGANAEITSPVIGTVNGRVSYIDPQLDESTRTGRVRIEVPNTNGKLRAGMFADVGFYTGTNAATGQELVVSSDAVQRTGGKTVVFVPREDEPGAFEVREIKTGADINGYTKVINGLKLGEKIVTSGSFTLKTQLEKGALGDDH